MHMTSMTTDSDLGELLFRTPSHTRLMAALAGGTTQALQEGGSERWGGWWAKGGEGQ